MMKKNPPIKNEYTHGKPSPYRKNPFKKDVFYGDDGQYAHPGQVTRIPGDAFGTHITMKGINQPLYARDNQGNEQMMQPGEDYQFPGQYVTEYPQIQTAQYGGGYIPVGYYPSYDNQDGSYSNEVSMGLNIDDQEMLLPSFWDGQRHNDQETEARYRKTGEHLGKFNTVADSERAAKLREFMNNEVHPYQKYGGWLDKMQKGGRTPIYVKDPNDPLLRAYQDSLSMHQQSKKAWHYGDTRVDKAEFDRKEKEEELWPDYIWAERKYKRDKKAGKVKNFEDYVIKTTKKESHSPAFQKVWDNDIFKADEAGYSQQDKQFTEKLPNGKIRTYQGMYQGKIDKAHWDEYDPITHTNITYSEPYPGEKNPTILEVSNPHMKPTSTNYWAFKNKFNNETINLKNTQENSTNGKVTFKNQSANQYKNYTWGTTANPQYTAPVQPVIYMPRKYNANDPRLTAGKKAFENTFNQPIPKKVIKEKSADVPTQLPNKQEVVPQEMVDRLERKPIASLPVTQEEQNIIMPKQVSKSDTLGKRIAWRQDPNTKKMVPVIGGMKESVKNMKRLYNKDIPTASAAIPEGFVPDYGDNAITSFQTGGWLDELDEDFRRGGMVNPLMRSRSKRSGTSKNIQSSINKLFLRNRDLFGPGGKNIYNPKSKYQDGGQQRGWLDDLH